MAQKETKSAALRNWKIQPALHRSLKMEAAAEGLTQNELAQMAFECYLREKKSSGKGYSTAEYAPRGKSLTKENEHWHDLLEEVLSRGGVGAETVKMILSGFSKIEVDKTGASQTSETHPHDDDGEAERTARAVERAENAIKHSQEARNRDKPHKRKRA